MRNNMALISLIRNLDYLMHEKRLNATELGELIGVPQSTTTRILNGKTANPSDKTLKKYADFFRVDIADLRYKDLTQKAEFGINVNHSELLSSPSVVDLITNIKDMESNGELTPQVVSAMNGMLEAVRSASASKKETKEEHTGLKIDVQKLADEANKQDE